jgi:hypothetical protein
MTNNTPPGSPLGVPPRPMSAMMRPPRSNSRMSMGSKQGGSRASDEDGKTAVKVGMCTSAHIPEHLPDVQHRSIASSSVVERKSGLIIGLLLASFADTSRSRSSSTSSETKRSRI